MRAKTIVLAWIAFLMPTLVFSATNMRHEAGSTKTGNYIQEGFFAGGDHTVTSAKLVDIRRGGGKQGFERVVLDFKGSAEKSAPYFQLQSAPQEGRLVLSIWADVMYDFDPARLQKAFAKSPHIRKVNVVPRVEEGLAIIEFQLKPGKEAHFEAFQLANPSRIIMDLQ